MAQIGLIVLYLIAIVAANLIVATFGPSTTIINAFLFIGLDITARDRLHDMWQGRQLWVRLAGLIAAGSLLSWLMSGAAGKIALASFIAFAAAGAADTIVYTLLRDKAWMVKVNGSNVVSAAVDSIVFPWLAFGSPIWWVVLGQFVAKVAGGAIWAFLINQIGRRRAAKMV
jgi:uncharacterized PurR-regulated membrane protein YhhQ (DUF165 family)